MKKIWVCIACACIVVRPLPAVAETGAFHMVPPSLVECKTTATCDRNPRHLEEFVARFYEWYVGSRNAAFKGGFQYPSQQAREQYIGDHFEIREGIIKNYLSPSFYTWYQKVMSGYDGQNPSPFCADPDAEPVLCQFDIADTWKASVSAQVISMDKNSSQLIVNLPEWELLEYPETVISLHPGYRLLVNLRVARKYCRIGEVKSLPDTDK